VGVGLTCECGRRSTAQPLFIATLSLLVVDRELVVVGVPIVIAFIANGESVQARPDRKRSAGGSTYVSSA
jgi:hypothetical protein